MRNGQVYYLQVDRSAPRRRPLGSATQGCNHHNDGISERKERMMCGYPPACVSADARDPCVMPFDALRSSWRRVKPERLHRRCACRRGLRCNPWGARAERAKRKPPEAALRTSWQQSTAAETVRDARRHQPENAAV